MVEVKVKSLKMTLHFMIVSICAKFEKKSTQDCSHYGAETVVTGERVNDRTDERIGWTG